MCLLFLSFEANTLPTISTSVKALARIFAPVQFRLLVDAKEIAGDKLELERIMILCMGLLHTPTDYRVLVRACLQEIGWPRGAHPQRDGERNSLALVERANAGIGWAGDDECAGH